MPLREVAAHGLSSTAVEVAETMLLVQPELAGKITGMLLEMENSELLVLLETTEALESKVDEAIQVLKAHNALPVGASN